MTIAISKRELIRGAAGAALLASVPVQAQEARRKPLLYAHRGSSALRPEHSLASYAKAIRDGADFIEPDLVITKDGVLVARHENNIAETTDIAAHPEFAGRRTRKLIDGRPQEGWFTEDFTLAELKTLRAVERMKNARQESHRFDGYFQIPTLEDVIDFVAAEASACGRSIGLVPELKHGTYFSGIGLPLEERFVDLLGRHVYTRTAPIDVQSFEIGNLRRLRKRFQRGGNVRLVQLVANVGFRPADVAAANGTTTYAEMCTPAGLREIATYADIAAPYLRDVIPLGPDGRLAAPTRFVDDAHGAGLKVVAWTFAPENKALAADFRSSGGDAERNPEGSIAEMRRYLDVGLDGLFTDDPALGRAAIDRA